MHGLEYQRLGLARAGLAGAADVSAELAGERARSRAEREPGRARDSYERDDGLQQRTGAVYAELAAAGWGGPLAGRRRRRRSGPAGGRL